MERSWTDDSFESVETASKTARPDPCRRCAIRTLVWIARLEEDCTLARTRQASKKPHFAVLLEEEEKKKAVCAEPPGEEEGKKAGFGTSLGVERSKETCMSLRRFRHYQCKNHRSDAV